MSASEKQLSVSMDGQLYLRVEEDLAVWKLYGARIPKVESSRPKAGSAG